VIFTIKIKFVAYNNKHSNLMMKINSLILRPFGLYVMCAISCSTEYVEVDDFSRKKTVPVTINLADMVWKDGDENNIDNTDTTGNQFVLINPNKLVLDNSKSKAVAMGDNNSIVAEVSLEYSDNTEKNRTLQAGDMFRVIVYDKVDGSYFAHKDYTVGNEPYEKLELNSEVSYTIVAYTLGSEILPDISSSEKNNIAVARVGFDVEDSPHLAYQKQEFIPTLNDEENVLDISLCMKQSMINIVLRSLGSGIPIDNAYLTSVNDFAYFKSAEMNLETGEIECTDCEEDYKSRVRIGKGLDISYNSPVFMPSESMSISFSLQIGMLGVEQGDLKNISFQMYQGRMVTVNVDIRVCGAYSSADKKNFKRFMCNDLGSEPINPNQKLLRKEQQGDLYQWGMNTPVMKRKVNQELPENRKEWKFDWSKSAKQSVVIPSLEDAFRYTCPEGWHVPSKSEIEAVVNSNNKRESLGSVKSSGYTSGYRIGDNLIFPTSGRRWAADHWTSKYDGDLEDVGSSFNGWTSDRKEVKKDNAGYIFVVNSGFGIGNIGLLSGLPVRCVK